MTMEEVEILEQDAQPQAPPDFNIYVGAETGILKGVSINAKMNIAKNFSNMHNLERKHEITAIAWGDRESQSEIILGLRGQIVRTFNPEDKTFTSSIEADGIGMGRIVGVARADDSLVVAGESGTVQVWRDPKVKFSTIDFELSCSGKLKANAFDTEEEKEKHLVALKVDRALSRMRQVPGSPNLIATGGKENDLQIWDLNKTESGPVFRAKNVPLDSLQLRVPVWVMDMCFVDNASADQVALVSRHGHVRLYDTRKGQRRPVINMAWQDEVLTAVSSTPCDYEIIVGTAAGHVAQYDLRMSHKGMRRKYRGCTGAIRSIDCHHVHKSFAVVGLDRFVRVFDINQPKAIQKMYLKSKLNHVLLTKDFNPEMVKPEAVIHEQKKMHTKKKQKQPIVKEDGDEFWAKLPVIKGSAKGKRGYVPKPDAKSTKKAKK